MQLANGTRLGRYEILAPVGAGGMGEVYRARDPSLEREVAIKVLPFALDGDPARLRRFEQEARAASALNHPNIVTIYEIGEADGQPYIAMELVEGTTLRNLIGPRPLPPKQGMQLALQLADALAKAHAAGIVHRDLKPENVMVTRDGLVKILDFGLAKPSLPASQLDSQAPTKPGTSPGVLLGTVGYMSPEQALGRPADFRSDQFACGAIFYEIATGRRAFQRESAVQTLTAIIESAPPPLASVNPAYPAPFRWAVERCLAKDPHDRFGSTRDLARALADLLEHFAEVTSSAAGTAPAPERPRQLLPWAAALFGLLAMALLLAIAALVALRGSGNAPAVSGPAVGSAPAPSLAAAPLKARRSVAVLGFKNLSRRPEAAWLSTALAEMLTTELAAGGRLRTVPGENVARAKIELDLAEVESLAADTLAKVGRNLGTDMVLLGSYLWQPGGRTRLDLRLQDVAQGETIVALAETGTEAGLVDVVTRAGSRLRQAMGIAEPEAGDAGRLLAGVPANLEAQRLFAEGLARLRVLDALAAKELLHKAATADPDAPLVHAALAEAWSALGYDEKARNEARLAFERSESLGREERLSVEARHHEMAGEWTQAIELHRALLAFFPDNLDYGLRLVNAQSSAGSGNTALATLAALRRLPPPFAEDPRIDVAEAVVAQGLGDYKRGRAAAGRAATKSAANGARLLVARARLLESYALERLGELSKAKEAADEARRIYEDAGDQSGVALGLTRGGAILWEAGEYVAARQTLEKALRIHREIGFRLGAGRALGNLGLVQWKQGDLRAALRSHAESEAIFKELGDKALMAAALSNSALALFDQGDLAGTSARAEQALVLTKEVGDRALGAAVLTLMGNVRQAQGDLAGASTQYQQALPTLQEAGGRSEAANALFGLGQLLAAQGDLAAARNHHQRALLIRSELGERVNEAESRVALAAIANEENRPQAAEGPAREAAALFARQQADDKAASALCVLARSLEAQGRAAEALAAAERAAALAASSQSPQVRLSVAIAAGRARPAAGRGDRASAELQKALAEAERLGFGSLRLEAALALGEVELALGNDTGRARLDALLADARSRGLGLLARRAAQALDAAGPAHNR